LDASRYPKLLLDTLAHQAQLVVGVPALHHLALGGEAEGGHSLELYLLAGGRHAPKISLVGASYRIVAHHLVPFCNLVLYADAYVGEGRAPLPVEALYVLGTTLERRAVGLVGDIPVEDLVDELQVAPSADLLGVTPEDGLVLFGGHVSLLLFQPAYSRVDRSTTEILPVEEAWRISGEGLFTVVRGMGILGSSLPTSNAQVSAKIAHLSDTPAPIREYGTHVTDKGAP
jgi:hypothetical protein